MEVADQSDQEEVRDDQEEAQEDHDDLEADRNDQAEDQNDPEEGRDLNQEEEDREALQIQTKEINENEESDGYNVFVLNETPDPVVLAFHPEDWLR